MQSMFSYSSSKQKQIIFFISELNVVNLFLQRRYILWRPDPGLMFTAGRGLHVGRWGTGREQRSCRMFVSLRRAWIFIRTEEGCGGSVKSCRQPFLNIQARTVRRRHRSQNLWTTRASVKLALCCRIKAENTTYSMSPRGAVERKAAAPEYIQYFQSSDRSFMTRSQRRAERSRRLMWLR